MKRHTAGRKPTIRSLPPLAEACSAFSGFKGDENRTQRIFEILTILIQRCRQAKPQAFYAMRDVATFFEVSLNTVARVYRRLGRDGVLILVRSSHSIIAAQTPRPRFAVRGVVCMPIWLPGFVYFLDWRIWFSQLEEELSRYQFVLEPIFYKAAENLTHTFVDRVLRFNPDYVLWSWPSEVDRMPMLSIADSGVPLVVIHHSSHQFSHQFPGRIYLTSSERGARQGIEEWETNGKIDNIVLPQDSRENATIWSIKSVLKTCSLPYRIKICPPIKGSLRDYLQRLAPDRRTGIIFDDELFYARLCATVPEAMFELFRRHRVMVTRQVTMHLRILKAPDDMTVDALIYPWKKLANRIALDLSNSKGIIPSEQVLLEAEWKPQIPLSRMVQTIVVE